MYYRVAGIKRDSDCKQMIIRASSKEEAKKQFPAAKAFLFPEENPEKCFCTIHEVPIKVNLGTTIPHFCITAYRMKETRPNGPEDFEDLGCGEWEMIISADSAKDAKAKGAESVLLDHENPDDYDIFADEMTIEECIQAEERSLLHIANNVFLELRETNNQTVKEYSDFCRQFDPENNSEQRYAVLKTFNKFSRILRWATKICDQNTCSIGKLMETVKRLYHCEDHNSFQKILDTLKT